MPRLSRDTITRTVAELIGENPDTTFNYFQPNREHNGTTQAKLRIPEHQRFYVWPESRKSPLVDSVMENCPLPLMVFTSHIIDNKVVWYIQDGQQRLMTLQKFMLGEFKWENKEEVDGDGHVISKYFNELAAEEKRMFLSYKITCEVIENPTPDQVADIFERLNCGKPLSDNDKFFNRRESPVISFILGELVRHPQLSENFRSLTRLNVTAKTRVELGDIVGAVVSILTNSVDCIRTSFDRIGHALYDPVTAEQKDLVYSIFKLYFATVKRALRNAHITKPKKCYLKLSGILGIWLYWRLRPEYYTAQVGTAAINRSCAIWLWFAKEIQLNDRKKEIFEALSAGHQRNIDTEALRARTQHLMENAVVLGVPEDASGSISSESSVASVESDVSDNDDYEEEDDE